MATSVNHRQLSFVWALSGTQKASATCDYRDEGWLRAIYWTMPSMSASTSGTLNIYDRSGHKVAAIGTNYMSAAGTSAVTGLEIPIESDSILEISLAAIPGSAAGLSAAPLTGYVDLYSMI